MDFNRFGELFPKAKFVKLAPFNPEELHDEGTRKKNKYLMYLAKSLRNIVIHIH